MLNDYGDEWDNLQSQAQEYTQKHEINGWENIIVHEIDFNTSNSKLNMFTNTKEVEGFNI